MELQHQWEERVAQYESVLPGNVGRPVSHWLQQWSCRLFLHQLSSSVATTAAESLHNHVGQGSQQKRNFQFSPCLKIIIMAIVLRSETKPQPLMKKASVSMSADVTMEPHAAANE